MFPRPDDRPSPHLSSLALEQIAAQELAGAGRDAAEAHLAACERCRARRSELERDAERFPREIDVPGAVDALVRAVGPAPRPWYRRPSAAATVVGLAACAVLMVRLVGRGSTGDLPGARSKGSLGFEVIRRDLRGHVEAVASGDRLSPGEAIRFRVMSREPGFLVIVGVDAARSITPYGTPYGTPHGDRDGAPHGTPDSTADATPDATLHGSPLALAGGVSRVLDGSIILDDTLGPERIIAVVCDWPITAEIAIALARGELTTARGDPRQLGRIAPACREASVLIEKVRP